MSGFASKEFMDGFKFARSEALKRHDEEQESQRVASKIGTLRMEAQEKKWADEAIAKQEERLWKSYEIEETT